MRVIREESNGVIHNIYPDGMPYPKEMLDPNIGGYRKCKHVYEYMGAKICPLCGKDTHEPDMELQAEVYKKHYEEGKHLKYKCDICGGTLRVWWDI
jgi:rRNA maturation protein Nop10